MGIVLTTIAGLILWVVLWALGVKAFDAFMITILIVLIAVAVRIVTPYMPGRRKEQAPGSHSDAALSAVRRGGGS